jgi:hypothetical protein
MSPPCYALSCLHTYHVLLIPPPRMNRRKADFKFAYKFLEDDI